MTALLDLLGIALPIIQAPMAGVSSPAMAAAVTEAGALGSIGVGAVDAEGARAMIAAVRALSTRPFNVNLFCHRPAAADAAVEAAWIVRWRPAFEQLGASPPSALREIYRSFVVDEAMLAMLLAERPAVVSFHFGLPGEAAIRALRNAGIVLLASATSLAEARAIKSAGVHAIVAQGWEAGGHRGMFDPDAPDDRLGTIALTRLLVKTIDLPIIAAGGIMDGAGIAAMLKLGAAAAQLGTAFVADRREPGRGRLQRGIGKRGGASHGDDACHLRPAGALPRQSLYGAGGRYPGGRRAFISDRLRSRQSAARRRQGNRRLSAMARNGRGRARHSRGQCQRGRLSHRWLASWETHFDSHPRLDSKPRRG